jgi:16S rRNA C967 or C1407 C5-methylase (RsmB/RsmF family)
MLQLSPELQKFYQSHNLDVAATTTSYYSNNKNHHPWSNPWRFIRLNPRFDRSETLALLEEELRIAFHNNNKEKKLQTDTAATATTINTSSSSMVAVAEAVPVPIAVPWLDSQWGFYALPSEFSLASSLCFRSGRIYGMDVSSGASVAVLLTNNYDSCCCLPADTTTKITTTTTTAADRISQLSPPLCMSSNQNNANVEEIRVLDLCACPGLKLLTMVDYFHQQQQQQQSPKLTVTSTNVDDDEEEETKTKMNQNYNNQYRVKIVGVDVNPTRMDKCKAIVQKYMFDTAGSPPLASSDHDDEDEDDNNNDQIHVQLYLADGTTLASSLSSSSSSSSSSQALPEENNHDDDIIGKTQETILVFDSKVTAKERKDRGDRRRRNKSARARQRKRLHQIAKTSEWTRPEKYFATEDPLSLQKQQSNNNKEETQQEKFDFVLVDAECSTDGSFKHIRERIKAVYAHHTHTHQEEEEAKEEDNVRLTDPTRLIELVALQRRLIHAGFRLLKPGGTLVYSTCSLSEDQNERIVSWLLEKNADAYLIPIHFPSIMTNSSSSSSSSSTGSSTNPLVTEGSLQGTVRFYPNIGDSVMIPPPLLGDGFFVSKLGKL